MKSLVFLLLPTGVILSNNFSKHIHTKLNLSGTKSRWQTDQPEQKTRLNHTLVSVEGNSFSFWYEGCDEPHYYLASRWNQISGKTKTHDRLEHRQICVARSATYGIRELTVLCRIDTGHSYIIHTHVMKCHDVHPWFLTIFLGGWDMLSPSSPASSCTSWWQLSPSTTTESSADLPGCRGDSPPRGIVSGHVVWRRSSWS